MLNIRLAVILFLIVPWCNARADYTVNLVLFSRDHLELGQIVSASSNPEANTLLYLNPQSARMRIIDETHVRIELVKAIHISLHDSESHLQQAEMVFKSFVLRIPKDELRCLVDFATQPYFVFDESNEHLISEMIRDTSEAQNFDGLIKDLSSALQIPLLRHFEGIRITLPIEDIGSIRGGLGRIQVIGSLRGHLPWFKFEKPSLPIERPLSHVFRTYAQDDEMIRMYLKGLSQLDLRWHELKQLGWLGPLMQEPQPSTSPSGSQTNNLTPLFSKMRCLQLFQK